LDAIENNEIFETKIFDSEESEEVAIWVKYIHFCALYTVFKIVQLINKRYIGW
jgi:hypothetical protein